MLNGGFGMGIRPAREDDAEKVYELICELEHTKLNDKDFKKTYAHNLHTPDIFYWVYEDQGKLLGFVSLHIQTLLHHCSKVGEIQELIVTGAEQGKNIGRELLGCARETAKANGCTLLEVCCNRQRTSAHGFYEACGMSRTHFKFTYYLDE
jgi:Acetyltransferases